MKRFKYLLAFFLSAVLMTFSISTVTGCKATQSTVTYKSISALNSSVTVALSAWADYVVKKRSLNDLIEDPSEKIEATEALENKEAKARGALSAYKSAMSVARIAVDASLASNTDPAPGPVLQAGNNFISEIQNLTK